MPRRPRPPPKARDSDSGSGVELRTATIGGLEFFDLELEGYEALKRAVEEDEVNREVLVAHLEGILRADEAEVAAEFGNESTGCAVLRHAGPPPSGHLASTKTRGCRRS